MKKLMIAATIAAMVASVQAITCVTKDDCGEEIQVAGIAHKVAISLKTTANKGKVSKKACEDGECAYWRQQATMKINGLLWEQLDSCEGCVPFGVNSAFWTKDAAIDAEFAIGVGLIGNGTNSKKIEAYGGLNGDEFGALAWAGFGTMASSTKKNGECEDPTCVMYVKSISGSIAGYRVPAEFEMDCVDCEVIAYEGCCEDDLQLANTAAYGTIKISYDKATSKKVALAEEADEITSFFKVPAAVAADLVELGAIEVSIEE